MPVTSPAGPGAAWTVADEQRFAPDFAQALGASLVALVAGAAMLTVSIPSFIVGSWLLLAACCTLVMAVSLEWSSAPGEEMKLLIGRPIRRLLTS